MAIWKGLYLSVADYETKNHTFDYFEFYLCMSVGNACAG
jgi:hypothetical protein